MTEFGRAVAHTTPDDAVAVAKVNLDAEETKAFRYPKWDGQHQIIRHPEPLGRYEIIGWHADVPDEYITDEGIAVLRRKDAEIADLRNRVAELENLLDEFDPPCSCCGQRHE